MNGIFHGSQLSCVKDFGGENGQKERGMGKKGGRKNGGKKKKGTTQQKERTEFISAVPRYSLSLNLL